MPLDLLRAVTQNDKRGNRAEAAGAQIHGRPVIDLAVHYRVHQPHHVRGQFFDRRRGLWIVVRAVIPHPELSSRLLQIDGLYFIRFILIIQVILIHEFRLPISTCPVWAQIGIFLFSILVGHGAVLFQVPSHKEGESLSPTGFARGGVLPS